MKNQLLTKSATYLILGFAIIALFLGSCSKDEDEEEVGDSGNGYSITFKVDGVLKEITNDVVPPHGSFTNNGKQYGGGFIGTGRSSSIGFQVYDTKAITKNDYIGYVITTTSGENFIYGAVLSYADGQLSYTTQGITNPTVHVKITEITATSVSGEFGGTLKLQNGTTNITITEGKFYVDLKSAF